MTDEEIQAVADSIVVDYLMNRPEFIDVAEAVDEQFTVEDGHEYHAVYALVDMELDVILQRWLDADS